MIPGLKALRSCSKNLMSDPREIMSFVYSGCGEVR